MLEQVKASAGSGKTYALTARFLRLLKSSAEAGVSIACAGAPEHNGAGFSWPEILAITFTNKAAAEMKERVIRSLKVRALNLSESTPADGWTPVEAARRLDTILRHYHRLNIRTIDSLLNLLVRLFALDLGLAPDFDVLFDEAEAFTPLFDRLAARAESGDAETGELLAAAVDNLLRAEGARSFWSMDQAVREKTLEVFRHRLRHGSIALCDLQALQTSHAACRAEFLTASSDLAQALERNSLEPVKNFAQLITGCVECGEQDGPPKSAYAEKERLAECLKKGCHNRITPECEAAYEHFKDALSRHRTSAAFLSGASAVAPFLVLADLLLADLETHQSEQATLHACRLSGYAARFLSSGEGLSDAFCRFGSRLQHLLIDEFQDTGRDQWQALLPLAEECLSKNGQLFLVGDVKQAIYGWRGGDAMLFDEVVNPLAEHSLAHIAEPQVTSLPSNWRSRPAIVTFTNEFFGGLCDSDVTLDVAEAMLGSMSGAGLAGRNEAIATLAAAILHGFRDCAQAPARTAGHDGSMPGLVRIETIPGNRTEPLLTGVQAALGRLLIEDVLPRHGLSETAILVRSNTEAALVAEWLLALDIPVMTENSLLLSSHPLIRQLVSFLAFLDYPLDDLAFWELVRGRELFLGTLEDAPGDDPGLTETILHDWLARQDTGPLYLRFRQDFPVPWNVFIRPFHGQAGLMSPYDAVREILAHFRVQERRPEDEVFLSRFMEVVHQAEDKGCSSLSTFLEFWNGPGREEKVPMPEHVEAVRIMTMHKAKGLEFPAVIVPFHHWNAKMDGDLAACSHEGTTVLLPLRKDLGPPYYQHLSTQLQEQLNLLYVAWTRAEEELHILLPEDQALRNRHPVLRAADILLARLGWDGGSIFQRGQGRNDAPGRKDSPLAPKGGPQDEAHPVILPGPPSTGDDGVEKELRTLGEPTVEDSTGHDPELDGEPLATREQIDGIYVPMAWLPRLKVARNFNQDHVPDLLSGQADRQRERGILVHRALEVLRLTGDLEADVRRAASRALAERTTAGPARDDLGKMGESGGLGELKELCSLLSWVCGLADFPLWQAKGLPEVGILDADGKRWRVDRLVLDRDIALVVEYKTGTPSPEHEAEHAAQVRGYLRLLGDMPGVARAREFAGVVVYLDERRVVRIETAEGKTGRSDELKGGGPWTRS